jgi:hypothetical protein
MNGIRVPLNKMFPFNGSSGSYYTPEILVDMKPIAENDTSEPNGCIIIHVPAYTKEPGSEQTSSA